MRQIQDLNLDFWCHNHTLSIARCSLGNLKCTFWFWTLLLSDFMVFPIVLSVPLHQQIWAWLGAKVVGWTSMRCNLRWIVYSVSDGMFVVFVRVKVKLLQQRGPIVEWFRVQRTEILLSFSKQFRVDRWAICSVQSLRVPSALFLPTPQHTVLFCKVEASLQACSYFSAWERVRKWWSTCIVF